MPYAQKRIYPLPPGFTPYSRKILAPVTPEGSLIADKGAEHLFSGTFFDAALDAAQGRFWPQESVGDSLVPLYSTQKRHLDRACLLLGIHADLDEKTRQQLLQELDVPGQTAHDSVLSLLDRPGTLDQGRAICAILETIPSTRVFQRLAAAGAIAGLWPTPQWWDPRLTTYRRPLFYLAGTRSPPN